MRIIAGKHKGRKIPDSLLRQTRPTTDFARTGLFSMILHRMELNGKKALDLYAGSGSIGFELLSRGCAHVTMVDSSRHCIRHLRKTAELLHEENADIVQADVMRFLHHTLPVYHLVFADPPFEFSSDDYRHLIETVMKHAIAKEGLFILEHQASVSFEGHRHFKESRRFGNVAFSFFAETNPL